ncbi:MAG: hypothetical protein PUP93_06205 [Rhizonema sp. NSF051]|nr:hypothetical protein [Rhizonema sp. NSF051]
MKLNRQAHQSSESVQPNPVVEYLIKSFTRILVAIFLVAMMTIVAQGGSAFAPGCNKTVTAPHVQQDVQANTFVPPQTEVEIEGLDLAKTGTLAYPNFSITDRSSSVPKDYPKKISTLER